MRVLLWAALATGVLIAGYYTALLVVPLKVLNLFPAAHEEVAYGPLPRQRMDVFGANHPEEPVVVFFHGGNWDSGAKEDYRFVATSLVGAPAQVVVPNYRLEPFPAFMEDAALAVAKVRKSYPNDRLYLMGHSAGAHIAALLALDPRYLEAVGLDRCEAIDGWIGLSGPYDFLPITSERTARTFPPDTRADSQPLLFAKAPAPPALLIHGTADTTVHAEDTELLAAALERAGVPVQTALLEGKGHRNTIAAFGRGLGWIADVREPVDRFLRNSPEPGC